MAREPVAGLVVPSQMDEDDLRAEVELEIPDSGQEPLLTELGDEIEIIEEEDGDVIVDFEPGADSMGAMEFGDNLAESLSDRELARISGDLVSEYDDLVDSMTQALMRYRQGNFVQLPTDDWQDGEESARIRAYY